MADLSENEKKDSSIRGVFFEACIEHCLNDLIPKEVYSREIHYFRKQIRMGKFL